MGGVVGRVVAVDDGMRERLPEGPPQGGLVVGMDSLFIQAVVGEGEVGACFGGIDAGAGPARAASAADTELYAKFYPRLYGYARRLADPAMAEDIVQEVFLRVLKYKNGNVQALPLQFLITMTKNVALRMLSSRRRELGVVAESASRPVPGRDSEEALGSNLSELLERLPERQREAIVLTAAHGLSEHQAGLAMNSSRSAVSARRRTGIEHLRRVGCGRLEGSSVAGRGAGRATEPERVARYMN